MQKLCKQCSKKPIECNNLCHNCNNKRDYKENQRWKQKRIWYAKHKKDVARWRLNCKVKCLFVYSKGTMKCAHCGENDIDVLTFDHLNNDGTEWRKTTNITGGLATYLWIIKNNFPPIFQVLCRNCNWKKHLNGMIEWS